MSIFKRSTPAKTTVGITPELLDSLLQYADNTRRDAIKAIQSGSYTREQAVIVHSMIKRSTVCNNRVVVIKD
jgi:hypothetical protein